jgi:predicted DNA-binding transcriptional regulator AlpA
LYNLIQSSVVDRLELIFAHVRDIEASAARQAPTNRRAIRLPEVLGILGISKSTLYSRLNPTSPYYDPAMPKPFKLRGGPHAERAPSVWWQDEVIAYLEHHADAAQRH